MGQRIGCKPRRLLSVRRFMNPRIFLTLLASLLFLAAGCVSQRSEVATKLGYEKSVMVKVGPYQLHYAHDGTNDFVLLTEGNRDLFARYTGEGTDVFLDGWPFIGFERSADGSVTNFSMHVSDIHHKAKYDLVDRNADGQWDMKIDDVTGSVYIWNEGGWVERYHHAPNNALQPTATAPPASTNK